MSTEVTPSIEQFRILFLARQQCSINNLITFKINVDTYSELTLKTNVHVLKYNFTIKPVLLITYYNNELLH